MGPEEFKEVAMVMGKDARRLHRMGILTGNAADTWQTDYKQEMYIVNA